MAPLMQAQEPGLPFHPDCDMPLKHQVVDTDEWTHVVRANFGEARPSWAGSSVKWTAYYYKYDIFVKGKDNLRQFALRWQNGGDTGWFICNDKTCSGQSNLLKVISMMTKEEERWDACHFLWQTAHKTALAAIAMTVNEYRQAFVDGRLKKKKKRGQKTYTVTIEKENHANVEESAIV